MTEKRSAPESPAEPGVPRVDFDDEPTVDGAFALDEDEDQWRQAREAALARDEIESSRLPRKQLATGTTPPPPPAIEAAGPAEDVAPLPEPPPARPSRPRLPGLPPPPEAASASAQMLVPRGHVIEAPPYVMRTRVWSFALDEQGRPIELGSGRFAKAFLGEERWVESKTAIRRPVAIKCLQRGVPAADRIRFQIEKQILERVQGHPNIVELLASGEEGSPGVGRDFIPLMLRDKLDNDFVILELLDTSLEDLIKGARHKRRRDDLLAIANPERLFRVLDVVLPVATAIEFAHRVRNVSHRDIKPANILLKLPDPNLRGSHMQVRLADFNVAKIGEVDHAVGVTRVQSVPGTLYFQSPEQETSSFELLVNCSRGSAEIDFFEDFYIDIARNDTFSVFNRGEQYQIVATDRARKKILLDRPFAEPDEMNVRGLIVKAVGRPADVYSIGALLYYLISGATGNPKTLFDSFKRFAEYESNDDTNTVAAYIDHDYRMIQSLRTPKPEQPGAADFAFEDRFFSYKQYLDGNGELIPRQIMLVIAKAMIRNKTDSYCLSYDDESTGVSDLVDDLFTLYVTFGGDPNARLVRHFDYQRPKHASHMRRALDRLFSR